MDLIIGFDRAFPWFRVGSAIRVGLGSGDATYTAKFFIILKLIEISFIYLFNLELIKI